MPLAAARTLRTFPKALKFDGQNAYVEVPYNANLNQSEFTIIIWFYKPAFLTGERYIVSHGLWQSRGWELYTNDDLKKVIFEVDANGSSFQRSLSISDKLNKWLFIAGTYRQREIALYLNMTKNTGTTPFDMSYEGHTDPIDIGKRIVGVNYSNGYTSQVLYYNHALSDIEIAQIKNYPLNPVTDGLVLWLDWTSIDIANGLWLDRSGYGNHGTIYGATEETIIKSPLRSLDARRVLAAVR